MRTALFMSFLLSMTLVLPCPAEDARARAIMEKVDALDNGDGLSTDMEMVLIDKRGSERLRRIQSFRRDVGEDQQQIMFFTHPPDINGTGFLTYDYDAHDKDTDKDDDQWLYLPALAKTKRIASTSRSDSFMGSDFNYSDLTTSSLNDYEYSFIKESDVDGVKVWIIEAIPVSKGIIDETGYKKSMLLIRQDNFFIIRAINWVQGGSDLKYMDVKRLDQIDGIWIATEILMTTKRNKATRHATRLRLSNISFDNEFGDELFTTLRLEKGP